MTDPLKQAEGRSGPLDRNGAESRNDLEEYDPYIGELLPDDGFAFTLLSCHCSVGDVA